MSPLINKRVDYYKSIIPSTRSDFVYRGIKKFLVQIKKYYPDILEEIKGMSVGSNIDILDLMLSICDEETFVLSSKPHIPKCTTLGAYLDDGDLIIGHNEDWLPSARHTGLALVKGNIKGLKFLSLFYIGSLPGTSCGLNSNGIGFSGNALDSKRFRYGIPKSVQLRSLLNVSSLREARRIDTFKSSLTSNLLVVSTEKGLLDSEDLWSTNRIFKNSKFLIHTNNPIEKKYQNLNNTGKESVDRYNYLFDLYNKHKSLNEHFIKDSLKTHNPAICAHIDSTWGIYQIVTIASVYMNVSQGFMDVTNSNPCIHRYKRYYL